MIRLDRNPRWIANVPPPEEEHENSRVHDARRTNCDPNESSGNGKSIVMYLSIRNDIVATDLVQKFPLASTKYWNPCIDEMAAYSMNVNLTALKKHFVLLICFTAPAMVSRWKN